MLEQVNKVQVKSITDSLFRYGLGIFTLGTISSIFSSVSWIMILLFSFGGLFLLMGLFFYCYFSFKNPDYLRSESFQIKKQSIELLGDKENQHNQNLRNVVLIASPYSSKELDENSSSNKFGS